MKEPIILPIINELEANLEAKNPFIQVILGPRQVGKTTSVLHYIEKNYREYSHYVSADTVFQSSSLWIREAWQEATISNKILVIDEVQKIPNWAEAIKSLWDEGKKNKKIIKCILLGSSSLEIQRGLTESLAGRFQLIRAYHWNYFESHLGYGLSFDEYLKFGGYPGSYPLISNQEGFSQYVKNSIVEAVIEKDILLNQTVKSPALFKQAFDLLSSYPAQEISYTKLLGQLQNKGNTELIKYYLKLYEGAFLVKVLEKFSTNKLKIRSSSPKILPLAPVFYFLNIQDDYRDNEKGRVFELIVGAQLVRTGCELFYWREGSDEVDYVLKKGRKIWAIEVKSGSHHNSKGLEKFKALFPEAKQVIITFENYQKFELDPLAYLESI